MTVWDSTGTEHTMRIKGDYFTTQAVCSCGWKSEIGHWFDVRLDGRFHQQESDTYCIGCFEHYNQHREGCEGIKRGAISSPA